MSPPVQLAGEPDVTPSLAREHGMTDEEYRRVLAVLGRTPSFTELGIFSVMWSEHCSYKSSRTQLRKLPTTGPRVVQGPGENAGVVDIGDGHVAVFKMESHNHPSYVEPHQGAATGVGGILRDVFTMGARPIASLNALRFGSFDHPRTRYLVHGVVAGIGGYGNCIGVPTVGGETTFHRSYDGNVIVNAFTLGIARRESIFLGSAEGVGNPVFYVGSRTGRDGIHGASLLASAEFDDQTESKRPTVQVGDPFTEKLLLEACLELMASDAIAGIQDMGAAGLTCSSAEMAGRAGLGMDLDLDRVPLRERAMTPYEIMLSESQERMLLVAHAGKEDQVRAVFAKWELECEHVGTVTDTGRLVVTFAGKVVADIPARDLAEEAPINDRPAARPAYLDEVGAWDPDDVRPPDDLGEALRRLLTSPNLCSKEWIWSQYDWSVRTNTLTPPGGDAAVVRVKETGKALAVVADCNPRYCWLDPRRGAQQAVAEAVRNLACVGAEPVGLTDCLNFGNPERPGIAWQFKEAVEGLSDACRELGVPVVSGNVSFYNETDGSAIQPTPALAMVGLVEDPDAIASPTFRREGDAIVLLGEDRGELGGTEYLSWIHGVEKGPPPAVSLGAERALADLLRGLVRERLVASAHDVSDGGLATCLAECCFRGAAGEEIGCTVDLGSTPLRDDVALFSESQARAVVSCEPARVQDVLERASRAGVPARRVGAAGGGRLVIERSGSRLVDLPLAPLRSDWRLALERHLGLVS